MNFCGSLFLMFDEEIAGKESNDEAEDQPRIHISSTSSFESRETTLYNKVKQILYLTKCANADKISFEMFYLKRIFFMKFVL